MTIGTTHTGSTRIETKVRRGCWARRKAKRTRTVMGSLTREESEFPIIKYSAWVSLVMREIKSPVRARLKKASERFCKWANNFVRKSEMARSAAQFIR